MRFTIGQVNIRIGLNNFEVSAPIAGHTMQVTIIPQNQQADTELQLKWDYRDVGHITIGGQKIPF